MSLICEIPASENDPTCNHIYNGYCYLPSTEMGITTGKFTDAQKICQSNNANLVSIHSKREIDYIISLFRGNTNFRSILIGAQQPVPNTYTWVDGSNWANFDYRDPMDGSSYKCLTMDISSGLWTSTGCDNEIFFLCKRPISKNPGQTAVSLTANPSDFSNCNTTFLMSPGVFTSYGYLSTGPPEPPVYCTWRIVTLGAYKVRLSFTNVNTYNQIKVYDEYGNNLNSLTYPNSMVAQSNIVTVTFQATGRAGYTGFRAVAQTY